MNRRNLLKVASTATPILFYPSLLIQLFGCSNDETDNDENWDETELYSSEVFTVLTQFESLQKSDREKATAEVNRLYNEVYNNNGGSPITNLSRKSEHAKRIAKGLSWAGAGWGFLVLLIGNRVPGLSFLSSSALGFGVSAEYYSGIGEYLLNESYTYEKQELMAKLRLVDVILSRQKSPDVYDRFINSDELKFEEFKFNPSLDEQKEILNSKYHNQEENIDAYVEKDMTEEEAGNMLQNLKSDLESTFDENTENLNEEEPIDENELNDSIVLMRGTASLMVNVMGQQFGPRFAKMLDATLNTGISAIALYGSLSAIGPAGWAGIGFSLMSQYSSILGDEGKSSHEIIMETLKIINKNIIKLSEGIENLAYNQYRLEENQLYILSRLTDIINQLSTNSAKLDELSDDIKDLRSSVEEKLALYFSETEISTFLDSPSNTLDGYVHRKEENNESLKEEDFRDIKEKLNTIHSFAISNTDNSKYTSFNFNFKKGRDISSSFFGQRKNGQIKPYKYSNLYDVISGGHIMYNIITGQNLENNIPNIPLLFRASDLLHKYQLAFPELRSLEFGTKSQFINSSILQKALQTSDLLKRISSCEVIEQGLIKYDKLFYGLLSSIYLEMNDKFRDIFKWDNSKFKNKITLISNDNQIGYGLANDVTDYSLYTFTGRNIFSDSIGGKKRKFMEDGPASNNFLLTLAKELGVIESKVIIGKITDGNIKINNFKGELETLVLQNQSSETNQFVGRSGQVKYGKFDINDVFSIKIHEITFLKGKFTNYKILVPELIRLSTIGQFNYPEKVPGSFHVNRAVMQLRAPNWSYHPPHMPRRLGSVNKENDFNQFVESFREWKNKAGLGVQGLHFYREIELNGLDTNQLPKVFKDGLKNLNLTYGWRKQLGDKVLERENLSIDQYFKEFSNTSFYSILYQLTEESIQEKKMEIVDHVLSRYEDNTSNPLKLQLEALDSLGCSLLALYKLNQVSTSSNNFDFKADYINQIFTADDLIYCLRGGLTYSAKKANSIKKLGEIKVKTESGKSVALNPDNFIDFCLLLAADRKEYTERLIGESISNYSQNDCEPLLSEIINGMRFSIHKL